MYDYYMIWSGALNFGDTPGVFTNAQFVGLLVQLPITITYLPDGVDPVQFQLVTTDVEIYNDKSHPVYWDWVPGQPFPPPVGYIDDSVPIPDHPELHRLSIPRADAETGPHNLAIVVNPEVSAGLKDDFVLERIEAHNTIGAKIGW